jgi:hypothetical protein
MNNLDQFVSFKKGTIPVILSVPHGGTLNHDDIPEREKGVFGIDKSTIALAHELIRSIEQVSESRDLKKNTPSYVMSKISRSKIDFNRNRINAYRHDSSLAEKIYNIYHGYIRKLISYNLDNFEKSILFDIHGFETYKRPEGYRDVDIVLGTNNLSSMFSEPVRIKDRDKNIRGEIIKKILELNIPIAPGHPKRKEYILTGGHITKKYGASNIPGSMIIQIEFSDRIRVYNKNLREKVLFALSEIIVNNID